MRCTNLLGFFTIFLIRNPNFKIRAVLLAKYIPISIFTFVKLLISNKFIGKTCFLVPFYRLKSLEEKVVRT